MTWLRFLDVVSFSRQLSDDASVILVLGQPATTAEHVALLRCHILQLNLRTAILQVNSYSHPLVVQCDKVVKVTVTAFHKENAVFLQKLQDTMITKRSTIVAYLNSYFYISFISICLPGIQRDSALEVLRNRSLQIDIYLLTYLKFMLTGWWVNNIQQQQQHNNTKNTQKQALLS